MIGNLEFDYNLEFKYLIVIKLVLIFLGCFFLFFFFNQISLYFLFRVFTSRGHFKLNSKVTCKLCIQIADTPANDLHGCQYKVRVGQKAKSILAYPERLSRRLNSNCYHRGADII